MTVIKVNHLTKLYQVHHKQSGIKGSLKALFHRTYTPVKAVDNLSFSIEEGELVGFIGPNGAGKTTTLKVLSGLLYPTSGEVKVLGFNPWKRQYNFLRQISLVMGQKNQLWWNLPAIETFNLFKEIYNLDSKTYQHSLDFLVETLNFQDSLHIQVRKLSLGQRMKAELIAALLHQPKVLFLDEPTIGLDVVTQQNIRRFIRQYNRQFHASIILTSHYMDDVKELARRILIISQGRLIYDGTIKNIINQYATHKEIEVIFDHHVSRTHLSRFDSLVKFEPGRALFKVKRDQVAQVSAQILQQLPVLDINIRELSLEEVVSVIFNKQAV